LLKNIAENVSKGYLKSASKKFAFLKNVFLGRKIEF
jgi:hypothetical protein